MNMNMTLTNPGEKNLIWKFDIRFEQNGKQYRKRATVKGSKTAATELYRQYYNTLKDQADAESKRCSRKYIYFKQCINYYIDQKKPARETMVKLNHILDSLGEYEFDELPFAVEQFISKLAKTNTRYNTPYKVSTINRYRSFILAALNLSIEGAKIDTMPKIHSLKKGKEIPRDRVLSSKEIESLFSVIDNEKPYLRPIVSFFLQIPCRKSELIHAKLSDVDLQAGILKISAERSKNGEPISKPIPPNLIDYFKSIPPESTWAFFREVDGKFHQLKSLDSMWKAVRAKAGCPDLRIHDARHHAITKLSNAGLPTARLMQVAGWKTDMMYVYYHKSEPEMVQAVQSILSSKMLPPQQLRNDD